MSTPPVQPRDAATVILARDDGSGAWECFMVRRHVGSEFAPDVYVFPGGKVDEGDRDPTVAEFGEESGVDLPFRVAAIREAFEEAGVLIARRSDGSAVSMEPGDADLWLTRRERVRTGQLSLRALAKEADVRFAPELLTPFARWITPVVYPRRYDTWFYVTRMPEAQEALHDALETTHGVWVSPREALRLHQRGEFPLVFATLKQLEKLTRYETAADLLGSEGDMEPIMPVMVERDGIEVFLMPGDEE